MILLQPRLLLAFDLGFKFMLLLHLELDPQTQTGSSRTTPRYISSRTERREAAAGGYSTGSKSEESTASGYTTGSTVAGPGSTYAAGLKSTASTTTVSKASTEFTFASSTETTAETTK